MRPEQTVGVLAWVPIVSCGQQGDQGGTQETRCPSAPCCFEPTKKFGESWGSLKVPCQKKEERQEGTKQGEAAVGSRG